MRTFQEVCMKKLIQAAFSMIAVIALFGSCNLGFGRATGSITLSFAPPAGGDAPAGLMAAAAQSMAEASGRAISPLTASFRVTISAADIAAPITASGAYTPGQAVSISVPSVPVGSARLITVTALDAAGGSLTEGSVTMDVVAGANSASVSLVPLVAMDLPPGPNGLQNQAVSSGSSRFFKVVIPAGGNYVLTADPTHNRDSRRSRAFASASSPLISLFDAAGKKATLGFNTSDTGYFTASGAGTYYMMVSTPAALGVTQDYYVSFDLDWSVELIGAVDGILDSGSPIRFRFTNAPPTEGVTTTLYYYDSNSNYLNPTFSTAPSRDGFDLVYPAPIDGWPLTANDYSSIYISFTDALGILRDNFYVDYENISDILWVREGGTGDYSRASPGPNIAAAILAANGNGACVVVGAGTYTTDASITINKRLKLLGGWDGGWASVAPFFSPSLYPTAIQWSGSTYDPVIMISGSPSKVRGFTIGYPDTAQYALFSMDPLETIHIYDCSPTLEDNTITAPCISFSNSPQPVSAVYANYSEGSQMRLTLARNKINVTGNPEFQRVENGDAFITTSVSGVRMNGDVELSCYNNIISSGSMSQVLLNQTGPSGIAAAIIHEGSGFGHYLTSYVYNNVLVSEQISGGNPAGWGVQAAYYDRYSSGLAQYAYFVNNILYLAPGATTTMEDYAISFRTTAYNFGHTNNYVSGFAHIDTGQGSFFSYYNTTDLVADATEAYGTISFLATPLYCPVAGSQALSMGLDPRGFSVYFDTDILGNPRTAPFAAGAYEGP
jgi:hypothetical protein